MKTKTLKRIPALLSYSRLLMALYFVLVSLCAPLQNPLVISLIIVAAILTDIFDGVLARKFKCYSVHLRQLDSKVDTIFWFSVLYLLMVMHSDFMKENAVKLFILLGLEIGVQIFGYFKFNNALALHTYAAKAWAVLIAVAVLQILSGNNAEIIFNVMFAWGLFVQVEVILIILKLKKFRVDVRSLFSI